MSELPDDVLRAVEATCGGRILGALRTAGAHPFGAIGDEQELAPLWVVLTEQHAILVAAHGPSAWVVADGEDDALRLARGWMTDAVEVAGRTIPLRTGTRRQAMALVATWRTAPRRGRRVEPPPPPAFPTTRAKSARAASLPEGWSAAVPAAPGSRWLMVLETATQHAFAAVDGAPVTAPVHLAITDASVALVALTGAHLAWRPVTTPFERRVRNGRVRLTTDGIELVGRMFSPGAEQLAVQLTTLDREARWAAFADHLVNSHAIDRALEAWAEAIRLEQGTQCWADIARLAWVGCDVDRAHAALTHALSLDVIGARQRDAWTEPVRGWQWNADRPQQIAAALAGRLGDTLDALDVPSVPDLLPVPAADETELWLGALAALERWTEVDGLIRELPETARAAQVIAALRSTQGRDDAAAAWRSAAAAWREQDHLASARRCLEQAIALDPTPRDHWQDGGWCWEDGHLASARREWLAALADDPEGHHLIDAHVPSEDAWRTLGAVAEAQGAYRVAARAWRRVSQQVPDDAHASWTLGRILAEHLDDAEGAAAVYVRLGEALEGAEAPARRPSDAWLAAAALQTGPARVAAIRRAVGSDFLHVDAWATATAHTGVPAELTAWWQQLHRLVAGSSVPSVRPPTPRGRIEREALDALHPGGVGWLENVRRTLDPQEPPPRDHVIRGLEPLRTAWPEADAALDPLCVALGLRRPEAFVYRGAGAWGVCAWPTEPPVLLIGHDHAHEGPRQLTGNALRFALAVELAHLAANHPLLHVDASLIGTSQSVYTAFGRYAGTAEGIVDVVTLLPGVDQLAKIERVIRISRNVFATRAALDKIADVTGPLVSWFAPEDDTPSGIGREGLTGAALQFRLHADRAALLVTADTPAAVEAILRTSTHSHVLAERVAEDGLAAVLADPHATLERDEAMRITALLSFAAQEGPP